MGSEKSFRDYGYLLAVRKIGYHRDFVVWKSMIHQIYKTNCLEGFHLPVKKGFE